MTGNFIVTQSRMFRGQTDKYNRVKPVCCHLPMHSLYIEPNKGRVKVGFYCRKCGRMEKLKR